MYFIDFIKKNDSKAYSAALKNGWLESIFMELKIPYKKKVKETKNKVSVLHDALRYNSKNDWRNESRRNYNWAVRRKEFFEKCTSHMLKSKSKRESEILEEALNIKYFKEWMKSKNFEVSRKYGKDFYEKCTAHMIKRKHNWTENLVMDKVLEFKTIGEWKNKSQGSYKWAKKQHESFFEQCITHMTERSREHSHRTKKGLQK